MNSEGCLGGELNSEGCFGGELNSVPFLVLSQVWLCGVLQFEGCPEGAKEDGWS